MDAVNYIEKLKSVFRFNFNLDRSLQNFFQGISNKISEIKEVIQEEREKQKHLKLLAMAKEKKSGFRNVNIHAKHFLYLVLRASFLKYCIRVKVLFPLATSYSTITYYDVSTVYIACI